MESLLAFFFFFLLFYYLSLLVGLTLLWVGLVEYMREPQHTMLFFCYKPMRASWEALDFV
jgi:hypothetical protein